MKLKRRSFSDFEEEQKSFSVPRIIVKQAIKDTANAIQAKRRAMKKKKSSKNK